MQVTGKKHGIFYTVRKPAHLCIPKVHAKAEPPRTSGARLILYYHMIVLGRCFLCTFWQRRYLTISLICGLVNPQAYGTTLTPMDFADLNIHLTIPSSDMLCSRVSYITPRVSLVRFLIFSVVPS